MAKVIFGAMLGAQPRRIQVIDKYTDGSHRAVFGDGVVLTLGKQRGLVATLALNKSAHRVNPGGKVRLNLPPSFHTPWARS